MLVYLIAVLYGGLLGALGQKGRSSQKDLLQANFGFFVGTLAVSVVSAILGLLTPNAMFGTSPLVSFFTGLPVVGNVLAAVLYSVLIFVFALVVSFLSHILVKMK